MADLGPPFFRSLRVLARKFLHSVLEVWLGHPQRSQAIHNR